MKTLLIISHPDYLNSTGQQFLAESRQGIETVTTHHLDSCYPDGVIDHEAERQLLKDYDRIILQFPLYWYSSPALLKSWQDQVFSHLREDDLKGKELGLILSVGVGEKEYRVGGKLGLNMDQLLSPFQGVAKYFEMIYMPHLAIYQFSYLTEARKKALIVSYLYYLTGPRQDSLSQRTTWFLEQLAKSEHKEADKVALVRDGLIANQEALAELNDTLSEMEG